MGARIARGPGATRERSADQELAPDDEPRHELRERSDDRQERSREDEEHDEDEQDEILVNEGYMGSGDILKLGERRLIVNPGGVGQPRDRDPRASYAIYDSDELALYHYRVTYDIESTQARMEKEGLPAFLVSRIGWGV